MNESMRVVVRAHKHCATIGNMNTEGSMPRILGQNIRSLGS